MDPSNYGIYFPEIFDKFNKIIEFYKKKNHPKKTLNKAFYEILIHKII